MAIASAGKNQNEKIDRECNDMIVSLSLERTHSGEQFLPRFPPNDRVVVVPRI